MVYVKVEPRNAEKAKRFLVKSKLLDNSRPVLHSRSYVCFPTLDISHAKTKKLIDALSASIISRKEPALAKPGYEKSIENAIGKGEFERLSKGYDQLGNIAIIEFEGKAANEKKIARILMQHNKSIKTVLAKEGAVSGKYRTRKVKYVAGAKNFTAIYRENGCIFRFDVRKVYFSNRLSFERSRILNLVKKGEKVIVMFAGVGPFAIQIAKKVKQTKVVAIELNKAAYNYMLENMRINKAEIEAVHGDVKRVASNYKNFADRIIMPLPKSSTDFLGEAYKVAKNKAVIHLYSFSDSENLFNDVYKAAKKSAEKRGFKIRLLNKRIVRPYSKYMSEIVLDILLDKN